MKSRNFISLAVVLAGLSCVGRGTQPIAVSNTQAVLTLSDTAEPTTQPDATPALPAGHPDISALSKEKPAGTAGLPAGHPDISRMGGNSPTLPEGHPDISAMRRGASTQPAIGMLKIHATQVTHGAPAIANEPVTVEVYDKGMTAGKIEARLDDKGAVTVRGIPVGATIYAVVRIQHGGANFVAAAPPLTADAPNQTLDVPVAQTTEQAPAWSIHMRHVMVQRAEDGLHVIDMLEIENPTDRAWLGSLDAAGIRSTFTLRLPESAIDVQAGGGFDEKTQLQAGKVINSGALVPGITEYQLQYTVPLKTGRAEFSAVAPAKVDTMMVFFPNDGSTVSADGLQGPETINMGSGAMRYFKGENLTAGKDVKLSVGVPLASPTTKSSRATQEVIDGVAIAKTVAGVGAMLIVLLGGALMLTKSPASHGKKR